MGLDMFLSKKTYVGSEYEHRKAQAQIDIVINGKKIEINPKRISYIEESVGYWRKANHIHNWFVQNVQEGKDDCDTYWVSKENLEQLLKDCKDVIENKSIAKDKIPTKRGFFFGSTEYDEYYFTDIENTIKIIGDLLLEDLKESEIYYSSSW